MTIETVPESAAPARPQDIDTAIVRLQTLRNHAHPAQASGYDEALNLLEAQRAGFLTPPELTPPPLPVAAEPARKSRRARSRPANAEPDAEPGDAAPAPADMPDGTPLRAAEAAEAATRAEHARWGGRVNALHDRGRQVGVELGEVATQLAAARTAALRGEDDPTVGLAALTARRHELEAERDELEATATLAAAEQAAARQALDAAALEANALRTVEEQAARVARSEELYGQIAEAYNRLVLLLNEFAELSEASRRMARIAPVGEIPFAWARVLVAPGLERSRIPFPGAW